MKRILIIDDEQKIRRIYRQVLSAEKFKVVEACDAQEALVVLLKDKIDLVLLDIKMPGMSAEELFAIIRRSYPEIKVVVSSVYSIYDQKEIVKGADSYYDKSDGIQVLLKEIKGIL